MDDLSSAINGFLSQPGAMEQLQQMAQQLGLSPPEPGEKQKPPEQPLGSPPEKPAELPISPEVLQGLMQAAAEASKPDEASQLLLALKPMLRPERQEKVDRAIRMLGLMRAAKTAGQVMGTECHV
jgi:hypothetical protein